jgi:DNA-binding response OmpR family regulator
MLLFFMENQGRVLTKNQIYEAAWGENQFSDDNSIMVAISKLRNKLQDEQYRYIQTIRGLGYRLEARHEE